ncbi:hypothetical protein BDQ17DRAFT_1263663, partial [Cyathus striatus]
FMKAYIYHLLHTHEMNSHSLLAIHNLTVFDVLFTGMYGVLARGDTGVWKVEIKHFEETYDVTLAVPCEERDNWKEVDLGEGKGLFARGRMK